MSMWGPGTWSSLPWGITRKDSLTYATKECIWRIFKTLIASKLDVSGLLFGRSGIKTLLKTIKSSCKSSNSGIPWFYATFCAAHWRVSVRTCSSFVSETRWPDAFYWLRLKVTFTSRKELPSPFRETSWPWSGRFVNTSETTLTMHLTLLSSWITTRLQTSTAKLNANDHRWVSELANFSFTINYRPRHSWGQEQGDAIWLSPGSQKVSLLNPDEEHIDSAIVSISRAELVNAQ